MRRLRKESREGQTASLRGADQSGRQSGLRILNARYNETNDFFLSLLLGTSPLPHAQEIDGVTVGNLKMDRNGEYLVVEMDVELSRLEVEANRAVLLTPRLVNGADSADLPAVGIYGRRRYYYYVRNGASMLSGDGETSFKAPKTRTGSLSRHRAIRRMDERRRTPALPPRLRLLQHGARRPAGPAGTLRGTRPLHSPACLRPADGRGRQKPLAERVRVHRLPGEQDRHLSRLPPQHGRTGQDRGHHRFGAERPGRDDHIGMAQRLRIARKSVDAQPHAGHRPYRSAEKHIRQLYRFDEGVIETDYEPEDWAGLRSYVERSNLTHRAEILALIDSSLEPDAKEAKIKRSYSEEYDFLLKTAIPRCAIRTTGSRTPSARSATRRRSGTSCSRSRKN